MHRVPPARRVEPRTFVPRLDVGGRGSVVCGLSPNLQRTSPISWESCTGMLVCTRGRRTIHRGFVFQVAGTNGSRESSTRKAPKTSVGCESPSRALQSAPLLDRTFMGRLWDVRRMFARSEKNQLHLLLMGYHGVTSASR